ncbi:MAG: hypothetical protein Q4C64_03615, partial [Erysipelotrichia bacterium]|nr:hypothetical protein [Erysipelotrichia bacterium]
MAFTNEKIEDLFIKLKELNCSSINNDLEAFQKLGEIYSAGDLLKKIWRELDYLYTKPIKPSKPDECKFKFGLGPAGPILKFFISGMFDWTGGMVESIGIFLLCLGLLVISIEL